jgi:secretory phospholipase A2
MEILKMKVFVYILTFLGYAWSGYGAGIISNLRDAILAAEHVFGDIFGNIITVAKNFKIAHEVFDAAVEENCKFTCPDGKKFCELVGCVREKFVSKLRKKKLKYCGI